MADNRSLAPALMAALIAVSMTALVLLARSTRGRALAAKRPPRIAFMTDRDGNFEIYIMERDGSRLANLTNDGAQDGLQSWSPQADAFAFVTTRGTGDLTLVRMDLDGRNLVLLSLVVAVDARPPIWSPSGEWIAFSGGGLDPDIYLVDSTGANLRNLTDHPGVDRFGAWSPDAARLLFVSDRDGGRLAIYVIDAVGSEPVALTGRDFDSAGPAWSPDGARIAYMSNRDGDIEIYVMNADGTSVVRLTNSPGFDGYPAWSPDGRYILFHSDRDGNVEVYVMDADGSQQRNLTNHPATDLASIWVP